MGLSPDNAHGSRRQTRCQQMDPGTPYSRNSAELFFRPIETVNDVLTSRFRFDLELRPAPMNSIVHRTFTSDLHKRIIFTGQEKWGSFYSGKRYETSGGITWRPNSHLLINLSESYNKVQLPENFPQSVRGWVQLQFLAQVAQHCCN
jgi:hypothetical protein